jgi:hypothetical protein
MIETLNSNNILEHISIIENGLKILSKISYYNSHLCKLAFSFGNKNIIIGMI